MAKTQRMNMRRVPIALRPLVPSVEQWGCLTEAERIALEDRADGDSRLMIALKRFAAKWKAKHHLALDLWGDRLRGKSSIEYHKFLCSLTLINEQDAWPKRKKDFDYVAQHIAELKRHGSYRLASFRMWAARSLPDYGPGARRAVPLLRKCLDDEDFRVRVWSHFALALIEGNLKEHRNEIERIRRGRIPEASDSKLTETLAEGREEASSALAELRKTPEERDLGALCGAAILGDIETATRLVKCVDVNAPDHNGQFAVQYAAGNDHEDFVALLLKHRADPNVKLNWGETLLHSIAAGRESAAMIKLFVRHGAAINALNAKGVTPLDVAIEYKRAANVRLLRRLGGKTSDEMSPAPKARNQRRSKRPH